MNLASVGVLQGNGAVYGRLLGGCFTLDFDSATACHSVTNVVPNFTLVLCL
jgi:hypothetical protein